MGLGRLLKLLAGNLAVVVGVLLALLFITSVVSDVIRFAQDHLPRSDERVALPNYPDKAAARQMFHDTKQTIEEYAPYVEWERLPMTSEYVNIDEKGLRVNRAGRDAGPGAPRVGFFGGSTMWGTGAGDDGTIPAMFDQLTLGMAVENYGMSGHTTRQSLARLLNLMDTNQMPDVVVFYDGYNHIWTHCNLAVTTRLNGHMFEGLLTRALTERPLFGYTYSQIISPIMEFWIRIRGKRKYVRNDLACQVDPERAEAVAETLVRIWEISHMLVNGSGGHFYAFLQPVAYVGHARTDHVNLRSEEAGDQFRTVYPILQRKIRERGLDYVVDLSDAFDGDEYIYIDGAHVTPNGNAIIAEKMLERIEQDVPIQRAP